MMRYGNRAGDSPILAFEIRPDAIDVRFADDIYRYSYVRPGRADVERMKKLATAGKGLATYISTRVHGRYESRIPVIS